MATTANTTMTQLTVVNGWWEREFPFDVDDDEEMRRLHEVLPTGYYVTEDFSAGYDAPDEDGRYIELLTVDD